MDGRGAPVAVRGAPSSCCDKPHSSSFPFVPGDLRAGNGFWNQCAHWRKKWFLCQCAGRKSVRISGARSFSLRV